MSTLLAEAHVFIHRHRCPLSARSRNPHVLLLLGVEDTRSAVSWCIWQLPLRTASTASRIASITSWGCFLWMSCPLFVLVGTSFYRRDLVVRLHAIQPSQQ